MNLTDFMEAIEFFVTGFEFGLASTMIGIRRMLPLIWSKESGVKDAVVAAYKRLYLNPQGGNQRYNFNSYSTDGLSHHYHLGESTFVFRGFRCDFIFFLSFFDEI